MQSPPWRPLKIFFRSHKNSPQGPEIKGSPRSQTESSYLLKYYPKYYRKLHLEKIDSSIALKVKGLKRLHHFTVNLNTNQRNDLTSIWLQRVRKDLKSIVQILRDDDEYSEGEATKWYGGGFKEVKWCPGIERIEMPGYFLRDPFRSPNESLKNSKEGVNRIFRYLTHAKNIKKIDLLISQQMSELLVKKLSKSKKLREKINDTKARIFCFESLNIPGLKNKNSMIARDLGHLTIDKLEGENLKEFGEILGALENLQNLRISLIKSAKVYETPVSELKEMSLSLFTAIESLPRLERLFMKFSGGIIGWIDSFALPKSLKELTLSLSAGNNTFAALASQDGGLQDAPALKNFYSKIQELPLLESLQLILSPLLYDDPKNVLDFVVPLLKGIPKLASLKLDLPSFPVEYYNKGHVLDFSCIFEAIQHLAPGLEELKISFPEFLRPVSFALDSQYSFVNLREMSINGNLRPNIDIKQVLMSLLGSFGSENKKRKLDIRQIVANCKEELERLLRNIQSIGDSLVELNAEVQLRVNIKEQNAEEVVESLIQFIKGMRYVRGLGASIMMRPNEKIWDLVEALEEKNVLDEMEIKMAENLMQPGGFCYIFKRREL